MKKLLLMLLCIITIVMSGCGDKYAKEKEALSKAEKTALTVEVPVLVKPDYSKTPKPTKADYEKYRENFKKLIEIEEKIVAETRKSEAKIDELLQKAENDSDKKSLQEFREKLRKERIEFVRKVSKGRLYGDTYIVGVGSTWQEIEMVYGKPLKKTDSDYEYEGIAFSDWYSKGVPPKGYKFVSDGPQGVFVNEKCKLTSDAGIKMGMSRDEVLKTLRAKYVKKNSRQKDDIYLSKGHVPYSKDYFDIIVMYSMQDTDSYNLFPTYKEGKLVRYSISPH